MENEREEDIFTRSRWLIGDAALESLKNSKVTVFGIGGVGGHCIEALARAGIGCGSRGRLRIVDCDTVNVTNINRQLIALLNTVGRAKTEVMEERLRLICRDINVTAVQTRLSAENIDAFELGSEDYVVDAIDDVKAKLLLAKLCTEKAVPLIASMGTGNKLHPELLRISDISKTHTCPLARTMRRELKKEGIERLKVVFSEEKPFRYEAMDAEKSSPASISFVPAAAGLMLAGTVVNDILGLQAQS